MFWLPPVLQLVGASSTKMEGRGKTSGLLSGGCGAVASLLLLPQQRGRSQEPPCNSRVHCTLFGLCVGGRGGESPSGGGQNRESGEGGRMAEAV